jgi:hypothetical protein
MYKHRKILFIISLFLLMTFISTPKSEGQGPVSTTILRQRVQYGYWEVTPVISNILTDWRVATGTWSGSRIDIMGNYKTITQQQAANHDYLIDPDGDTFTLWQTRKAIDLGAYNTSFIANMYTSAPPVGFSVGHMYLSDANGIHWSKADGEKYTNLSAAADGLSIWHVIPNYTTNKTYVYRQIPYSMKVCFWTQGVATYNYKSSYLPLLDYWWQDSALGAEVWGYGSSYFKPDRSYGYTFDWVNESYLEMSPVKVGLNLEILAPLWTAQATQLIQSPDGSWQAKYDDSWIGIIDAKLSNIYGGYVDPTIPATPAGKTSGLVDGGQTGPAPTTPEIYTSGNKQQVITPAPSQAGTQGANFTEDPDVTQGAIPYSTIPDSDETNIAGAAPAGFPAVTSGGLVQDPKYYESYFLASSDAMGASLGNVQSEYIVQWNDTNYQSLTGLRDGSGNIQNINYNNANASYINSAIRNEITNVDRQYASDLALSVDIPNKYDITLGATLKPALHSWYTELDWVYKRYSSYMVTFGGRKHATEVHTNVVNILSGQEIINVFIQFTITCQIAIVDRYNNTRVPGANQYTDDDLTPWVKLNLHNNTYSETAEWYVTYYGDARDLFAGSFWLIFGVLLLYFVAYKAYQKRKRYRLAEGGGQLSWMEALGGKWGIIKGVVMSLILSLVLQLVINFFTGAWPF